MIHPRSLDLREPRMSPPRWWCSNCRTVVDGPWHERDCPNEDREVGS